MTAVYAGLDVSDKQTHICIVDGAGTTVWHGVCASDPEALSSVLKRRAPGLVKAVLETGPTSSFLYHGNSGDSMLNSPTAMMRLAVGCRKLHPPQPPGTCGAAAPIMPS